MTLDELKEKLEKLEEIRTLALSELSKIEGRLERITALEDDKDALLKQYAALVPESLMALSPQERSRLYHMLKLEVAPIEEGLQVSGILGDVCNSRTATKTATLANSSDVYFRPVGGKGGRYRPPQALTRNPDQRHPLVLDRDPSSTSLPPGLTRARSRLCGTRPRRHPGSLPPPASPSR